MKKTVWIIFLWGYVALTTGLTQEHWSILVAGSHRQLSGGLQYTFRERFCIPLLAGVDREFNEQKWNDAHVALEPHYLLGKNEGKWYFPVGILAGVKWIRDHGNRFPVGYYGGYTGILYKIKNYRVGLNVGMKTGKNRHLLIYQGDWGSVRALEEYKEKPLFFSLRCEYHF